MRNSTRHDIRKGERAKYRLELKAVLRTAFSACGMSQEDLADECGNTQQVVSRWFSDSAPDVPGIPDIKLMPPQMRAAVEKWLEEAEASAVPGEMEHMANVGEATKELGECVSSLVDAVRSKDPARMRLAQREAREARAAIDKLSDAVDRAVDAHTQSMKPSSRGVLPS